jgi:hypothetical protein
MTRRSQCARGTYFVPIANMKLFSAMCGGATNTSRLTPLASDAQVAWLAVNQQVEGSGVSIHGV